MINDRVLGAAQDWLGTPYQHQASCKGAGTDCLGLLRGIWREIYGDEPEMVPSYSRDWAEAGTVETLLEACGRNLIAVDHVRPGDVLVLRMRAGAVAKHLAIVAGQAEIIHAYSGHGVVRSTLTDSWARKVAGRFRFPRLGA